MSLVFNPSTLLADRAGTYDLGGINALIGTLTFAGSYATGGDTFTAGQTPEDFFKRIGAGIVLGFATDLRGHTPEWDRVAKKLKLYSSGSTELAAAAYNAVLTTSPVPVVILGR